MRKLTFTLVAAASLAVSAHAIDLNGSNWNFQYQGHYAIAGADVSGLGLTSVVAATLSAQLLLLNGTISSTQGASLGQTSGSSVTTGYLNFDAHGGSLLLPAVKTLLYNVLDANDGFYNGSISGTTLSLSKAALVGANVDALGIIDTRIAGIGVVLDLRAALPYNSLTGTIDGFDAGSSLPYGIRGNHVTGTAGLMDTIGLQARATVYTLGFGGIQSTSAGFVNVGVIQTTADSWSLSRSVQAVPSPGSFATFGFGALGMLRRRRRNKTA